MNNHFTIPHTPGINWLSHFEKEYIVGKAEGGRTGVKAKLSFTYEIQVVHNGSYKSFTKIT